MSNSELQALFLRHMRPLQAYLNAKLRDPQLAADLAQESFTRLTEQYPQGNILDIEAYLYKTAKNLMLDHLRQQQRRQTEAVEDDILAQYPSGEPALEQLAIDGQLLQLLQQALAGMPPRTQQIFRLNRLDGLTQAQVAAQLGVSLSTVEKHLASALEQLMARMEEQ
ncbi:TPA: RNA polymerase sigma factor [Serratia marcescens]